MYTKSKAHLKFQKNIPRAKTGMYRGADKSLARPGRKQARMHVRDARDFETQAVKFLFPGRQGTEGNSSHSDRNISLFPSWSYPGDESLHLLLRSVFCQQLLFCSCLEVDSPAALCQPRESLSFPNLV